MINIHWMVDNEVLIITSEAVAIPCVGSWVSVSGYTDRYKVVSVEWAIRLPSTDIFVHLERVL